MLMSMPMLTDQLSRRWTATGNWFRTDQHMRSATFWLQIVKINGQIKFWANLSIVITNVVIIWSYGDMSSWMGLLTSWHQRIAKLNLNLAVGRVNQHHIGRAKLGRESGNGTFASLHISTFIPLDILAIITAVIAGDVNYLSCSYRPSQLFILAFDGPFGWVALSFLFVVCPSRYGKIRPNLHCF